jgi:RND family efflux transporter MFP subunit
MATGEIQAKSGINWVPIVLVGALVAGGFLWRARQTQQVNAGSTAIATSGQAKIEAITVVKTTPVRVGTLTQTLDVTGTLRSNQNINLGSKIIGRVSRVLVREGSRVRRGQLLVTLDNDDLLAQVRAAQANLNTTKVRLAQTQTGLPARIQQVGTNIQQARATLETAQARYQQALLNEPLQVRNVETSIQQAEAAYQQAQSRLKQAQLNEPSRVAAAQAQLNNAREVIKTAQARLEQARTTAKQTEEQVEADINRTRAGLEASRAALAEVQRGARDQQIAQAQAQVNLAEAQLRDADTELKRAKVLFEGGAAPRQSVDAAQTRSDVAQAQLEAARQNLSLVKEGATTEQVRQAQEAVRQAEAALATAQSGRARVPIAQGEITAALAGLQQAQENERAADANLAQIGISRQETRAASEAVDQARGALDAAVAQRRQIPITRQETRVALEARDQAKVALDQAIGNRSQVPQARQDVLAAQAAVQGAQAQLEQANVNLASARIFSPVNGVVSQKIADVGQTVSPSQTLLNLIALDEVYFEAQVSENELKQLREGQTAQVNVPSISDAPLLATVTDIIPAADARSRQFRVRISIPRSPRELPVGAFARGKITTQVITNALIVPADAINKRNGASTLLAAIPTRGDEARIKEFNVETGVTVGRDTQILGGVARGDRIITGNPPVGEGDKVKLSRN